MCVDAVYDSGIESERWQAKKSGVLRVKRSGQTKSSTSGRLASMHANQAQQRYHHVIVLSS